MKWYLAKLREHINERPLAMVGVCIFISFAASPFKLWWLSTLALMFATPLYVWYIASSWSVALRALSLAVYVVLMGLLINNFANIYLDIGLSVDGKQLHSKSDAIYFSIATWITGDIRLGTHAEAWVATEALMGYVFLGLFVALLMHTIGLKSPQEALREALSCELCRKREATISCMRSLPGTNRSMRYRLCEQCAQDTQK